MRYFRQGYELPVTTTLDELQTNGNRGAGGAISRPCTNSSTAFVWMPNVRSSTFARVALGTGTTLNWPEGETDGPSATHAQVDEHRIYFDGDFLTTPIYDRAKLNTGQPTARPGDCDRDGLNHGRPAGLCGRGRSLCEYPDSTPDVMGGTVVQTQKNDDVRALVEEFQKLTGITDMETLGNLRNQLQDEKRIEGRYSSYAQGVHSNPRFYKYYWQVYISPPVDWRQIEGEEKFERFKRNYRVERHDPDGTVKVETEYTGDL